MIAFLGIPVLAWFIVFFGAGVFALGAFLGFCIYGREEPVFEASPVAQPEPANLDDWLAAEEPFREFDAWKRPVSEVRVDRGVVS